MFSRGFTYITRTRENPWSPREPDLRWRKCHYRSIANADSRTAELRPVTVAQISEGQALIDSGLKANETVVVDGQYRLQQGSPVQQLHGKAAQEADLQSAVQDAIP